MCKEEKISKCNHGIDNIDWETGICRICERKVLSDDELKNLNTYIKNYNKRNEKHLIEKLKEGSGPEGFISRIIVKDSLLIEEDAKNAMDKVIEDDNVLAFISTTDGLSLQEKEYVKQCIEDRKKFKSLRKYISKMPEIYTLLKEGKTIEEACRLLDVEYQNPKLNIKDEFLFDKLNIINTKKEYAKVEELQDEDINNYKKKSGLIRDAFLSKHSRADIEFPEGSLLTKEQQNFINAGPDKSARMAIMGDRISKSINHKKDDIIDRHIKEDKFDRGDK